MLDAALLKRIGVLIQNSNKGCKHLSQVCNAMDEGLKEMRCEKKSEAKMRSAILESMREGLQQTLSAV